MKKLLPFLFSLLLVVCTGCFNTTEEITIRPDGSGLYGMTLDFSGMFDMMKSMAGDDASDKLSQQLKQGLDTVIRFSSFTDTSTKLTADEKALMKDATMHMVMQEESKKFVMEIKYPFAKTADIERIMQLTQKSGNVMGKALGAPDGEGSDEAAASPDLNSYYDLSFSQGVLEKKINEVKLKAFQDDPKFGQMKQASGMFADATISSIIRLPKAAKKISGPNAKLSDDKKTVTVAASMSDALEDPKALTFRVEY